jgi:hypothetical protein
VENLVQCPACEGRGAYCLRANDQEWSQLIVSGADQGFAGSLCDFCNGTGLALKDDAVEFDPDAPLPVFPYRDA